MGLAALSSRLGVHPSTVSRAMRGKYLQCRQGTYPLRYFFSRAIGGLSRQAVSKWEADQAVPTMDNLMELSRLFGVPVDTLLRPDAPFPAPPAEGGAGKENEDAPAAPETPHKGVSLSLAGKYSPSAARRFCAYLSR